MSNDLIDRYVGGCEELRRAVAGMSEDQLDAQPVAGKWSTRQVVAHLADCEIVYADRIKRVLAEEQPTLMGLDPDVFAARLDYEHRDLEEELALVAAVRMHLARLLRTIPEEAWSRTGVHSEDGPLTVRTLLERITGHIPHHVQFIAEKRAALA